MEHSHVVPWGLWPRVFILVRSYRYVNCRMSKEGIVLLTPESKTESFHFLPFLLQNKAATSTFDLKFSLNTTFQRIMEQIQRQEGW